MSAAISERPAAGHAIVEILQSDVVATSAAAH
jgi:hypothetical protein